MSKYIAKTALLFLVCAFISIIANAQQPKISPTNSDGLLAAKAAEYKELKNLLTQENELDNVLVVLRETARENDLNIVRFQPIKQSPQGFTKIVTTEVEVQCNFASLRNYFSEVAKLSRLVSINDFQIKQLQIQSSENTLHAQFVITIYYATDDSFEKKQAATQAELVKKIADFDARIETIKKLRASQAAPIAVLKAIGERISMVEGLYLESIEQSGEQITIKGNAPNESAITQFGRSLEFTAGLFSNQNIKTTKTQNSTINFTIRCTYNPLKVAARQ